MAISVSNARRRAGVGSAVVTASLLLAACSSSSDTSSDTSSAAAAAEDGVLVGLITKTNDNPFYVKMREGAEAQATKLGFEFQSAAGTGQSDNESQVAAIENLVAAGAKGILITPADSSAIIPAIQKAQDAGVVVFALDSPTDPVDAADGTFATDNFMAGENVGKWAKAKFDASGTEARIAMLDLSPAQVKVDVDRNQGFLQGFGVDLADPKVIGDETDPRIAGNEVTDANEEGGRAAMEKLLQKDPSINLVYTINEPAAAGAYEAIKAAGKADDITIVSVDGGCPGVQNVQEGVIGATSMQFPIKMAEMGMDAVAAYLKDGTRPQPSPGLDFTNTGVTLISDQAADGIDSEDSTWGLENCWG